MITQTEDTVSVCFLVAMLLGLFSWLKADILHSLTLLEGGIR